MSDNMCPICLGIISSPAVTDQCRHQFRFLCIERWSQYHYQCPVCRQPFPHIQQRIHRNPQQKDRQQIHRHPQPTNRPQIQRHPQPKNRPQIQRHIQRTNRPQIQRHPQPTDRQQVQSHPQPTEAINNFNTNTIINGGNITIGRMYSQLFFFVYDLESDQQ